MRDKAVQEEAESPFGNSELHCGILFDSLLGRKMLSGQVNKQYFQKTHLFLASRP